MASDEVENQYTADESKFKAVVDELLEGDGQFLDKMYGYKSRLPN